MAKTEVKENTELAKPAEALTVDKKESREILKSIKSVDDIIQRFGGKVVEVREVVGDFALVDSSELVGKPFMVAHWEERESEEFGQFTAEGFEKAKYVSVYVITRDDKQEKLVFNDGGVGIKETLENFTTATNQRGGLNCPFGLRASEYDVIVDGKKSKATTMYFATSKPKS